MAIHIETVGYISIHPSKIRQVREWVSKHQLSDMDCHETEILTDVDADALVDAVDFMPKKEIEELIEKCDVIKFYW
jgi:S-adenosylmethionine:diacylglycerol 3-amino-3-carboxypropyl transferase